MADQSLSLQQQQALAMANARRRRAEAEQQQAVPSATAAPPQPDGAADIGLSVLQGAQNTPGNLAGSFGDVQELLGIQAPSIIPYWSARLAGKSDAEARAEAQRFIDASHTLQDAHGSRLPRSAEINDSVSNITGFRHTPQTEPGRYAQTITEFLPAMVGAEGTLPARFARAAVPAVASETAGQVAHEYAPSLEVPARIGAAIAAGHGVARVEGAANDARYAAQQRAFRQNQAEVQNQQLASEVAPLTRGERTGNLDAMHEEQRMRMGASASPDETQGRMQTFDYGRAQTLQDRVLNDVGERGGVKPWGNEPGPGDLESAGNDLVNSLRSQRRDMLAQSGQQYRTTYEGLNAEPVSRVGNSSVVEDVTDALRKENIPYEVLPANTRQRLQQFQSRLDGGEILNQADVERVRQDMNGDMGAALRQGGMQERDMRAAMRAFDDWRAGTLFQQPIAALRQLGVDTASLEEAARAGTRSRDIAAAMNKALNGVTRASRPASGAARSAFDASVKGIRARIDLARNLEQARAMHSEAMSLFGERMRPELSSNDFGDTGRVDLGGRQIANLLDAERTGESIMRKIFGNFRGSLPESSIATLQRIRGLATARISYTNRGAASGVRTPGREVIGSSDNPRNIDTRLTTARRFLADTPQAQFSQMPLEGNPAGVQLPTTELQAVRRGYLRVLLEELNQYIETTRTGSPPRILPIDTLANKFNRALTGEGRRVTELLFTDAEVAKLERVREWLNRTRPPAGSRPVSSPAAIQASWNAFRALLRRIPLVGPIAEELGVRQSARNAAERAVRQPKPVRPMAAPQPPKPTGPPSPYLPFAAAEAGNNQDPRPLGASYGIGEEPVRRRLGQQ